MSGPRRLWIDKTGQPVITTTANGERNAQRWGWTPARAVPSDPAPAPSVVPEAAVEAGVEAARQRLTWPSLHWEKSWIDPEAWPHVMHAALTAALPFLTAAPSATREEVAAVVDGALNDASYEDGTVAHDAEDGIADALLARFNITPKEDR